MGGDWAECTWGELATLEYGKALRDYSGNRSAARVFGTNGPVGWHGEALWEGPGVIIGRKGAYRGVHYTGEPYWVIDTAYSLQPKPGVQMDMRWAYYQVKHLDPNTIDDGSPIPSTTRPAFYAQPLSFPPYREQQAIAEVLGALDDKIGLNRRTAETLEATARALFKSWFVDFDPVRAKAEGRSTGLPDALATLFPSRFTNDGLPEGWEVRSLYDFARVVYGAPFSSARFNSEGVGLPLIRVRDLAAQDPDIFTDEEHRLAHVIEPGDIIVGMDGEFRCHFWRGPPAYLNQRLCHFEPADRVPRSFVALSLHEPLARFEAGAVGTTVIHLGKKDLDTVTFVYPTENVLAGFGDISESLIDQAISVAQQSRTLAALRDTLLPKLISGELRIRDAERVVAVA